MDLGRTERIIKDFKLYAKDNVIGLLEVLKKHRK